MIVQSQYLMAKRSGAVRCVAREEDPQHGNDVDHEKHALTEDFTSGLNRKLIQKCYSVARTELLPSNHGCKCVSGGNMPAADRRRNH